MEEITANEFLKDGTRRFKVLSDKPLNLNKVLSIAWNNGVLIPKIALPLMKVTSGYDEILDLHSFDMQWPAREPMDVLFPFSPRKFRRFVVWGLTGERVSQAIRDAANYYESIFHGRPQYAFMCTVPSGAEDWPEIDGVQLHQASWAYDNCVLVGGLQHG